MNSKALNGGALHSKRMLPILFKINFIVNHRAKFPCSGRGL